MKSIADPVRNMYTRAYFVNDFDQSLLNKFVADTVEFGIIDSLHGELDDLGAQVCEHCFTVCLYEAAL